MLKKKLKVSRKLFDEVFKNGRYAKSSGLLLKYAFMPGNHPSVSFVVPKTVAKKAIARNLLKRRGYAAIKKVIEKISPSAICIFVFQKGSSARFGGEKNKIRYPFLEIEKEINHLLVKARVLI